MSRCIDAITMPKIKNVVNPEINAQSGPFNANPYQRPEHIHGSPMDIAAAASPSSTDPAPAPKANSSRAAVRPI